MDPTDFSKYTASVFLNKGDGSLQSFRHYVPTFVLRSFCRADRDIKNSNPVWYPHQDDKEDLCVYDVKSKQFNKLKFLDCFGEFNIYKPFFESLNRSTYEQEAFDKFERLKYVDHGIFVRFSDKVSKLVAALQKTPLNGSATVIRKDLVEVRKYLFLMASLQTRGRNQHLLRDQTGQAQPTAPDMSRSRADRHQHMQKYRIEHPRDLWLRNSRLLIDTNHYDIARQGDIFDLDRVDYIANARDRFVVFWQAPEGEEFLLTDNSFGCFEGGELGSFTIPTTRNHEKHIYTNDYKWHQLFVLSPKLVMALCHGSIADRRMARRHGERYGVAASALQELPHPIPEKYYQDLSVEQPAFMRGGNATDEMATLFAPPRQPYRDAVALETRSEDRLQFKVSVLTATEVNTINALMLQNQPSAPVESICSTGPVSFYNAVLTYSNPSIGLAFPPVPQNDYSSLQKGLRKRVEGQLKRPAMLTAPYSSNNVIHQQRQESPRRPTERRSQTTTPDSTWANGRRYYQSSAGTPRQYHQQLSAHQLQQASLYHNPPQYAGNQITIHPQLNFSTIVEPGDDVADRMGNWAPFLEEDEGYGELEDVRPNRPGRQRRNSVRIEQQGKKILIDIPVTKKGPTPYGYIGGGSNKDSGHSSGSASSSSSGGQGHPNERVERIRAGRVNYHR